MADEKDAFDEALGRLISAGLDATEAIACLRNAGTSPGMAADAVLGVSGAASRKRPRPGPRGSFGSSCGDIAPTKRSAPGSRGGPASVAAHAGVAGAYSCDLFHPLSHITVHQNRLVSPWTELDNRGCVSFADLLDRAPAGGRLTHILTSTYTRDLDILRPWAERGIPTVIILHNPRPEDGSEAPTTVVSAPSELPLPNVTAVLPSWPGTGQRGGFGTMHTKVVVARFTTALRVAVVTSNLAPPDWGRLSQHVWTQDFPYARGGHEPAFRAAMPAIAQEFASDLEEVLRSLGTPPPVLAALQQHVDFSPARVHLVQSAPGYHRGQRAQRMGQLRLRALVARYRAGMARMVADPGTRLSPCTADLARALGSGAPTAVVCQCSSVGQLTGAYVRSLVESCNGGTRFAARGKGQPGIKSALAGQGGAAAAAGSGAGSAASQTALSNPLTGAVPIPAFADKSDPASAFHLVYPSAEQVATGVNGVADAGCLCLTAHTLRKGGFPHTAIRHYLPPRLPVQGRGGPYSVVLRHGAVPHSKIMAPASLWLTPAGTAEATWPAPAGATAAQGVEEEEEEEGDTAWVLARDWAFVGSHNVSRSAWGSTKAGGSDTLHVLNYELGVFLPPVWARVGAHAPAEGARVEHSEGGLVVRARRARGVAASGDADAAAAKAAVPGIPVGFAFPSDAYVTAEWEQALDRRDLSRVPWLMDFAQ